MNDWNYIYICEDCGSIVTITRERIDAEEPWACADCDSEKRSEFTEQAAALAWSEGIRESKYREEMARIDAALARIPQ